MQATSIVTAEQVDLVTHPPPFFVVQFVKYPAQAASLVKVSGAVLQFLIVQYAGEVI